MSNNNKKIIVTFAGLTPKEQKKVTGRLVKAVMKDKGYRKAVSSTGKKITEEAAEAAARAAEEVENALLKRATGYDTGGETPKHVPPDVRAAIFYLKNRRPKNWKDRQEISVPELPEIRLTVQESEL